MLNVSTEWQNASRNQFRYQAYLWATLELTPPGLRQGAVISSDSTHPNSRVNVLTDGIFSNKLTFGSLEPNRIPLDGSCTLMSRNSVTSDWWSKLPVEDGNIVLHFEFDKTYTIPGIYIVFDQETNNWPSSFKTIGYGATGDVLYSTTIENITSVTGYFDNPMDDVKAVDLVFGNWDTPDWRVRITEVMFGLYISFDSVNNGRIAGATQTSKSDPLSASLPTHNMQITFRNIDKYFDPTLQEGISKYLAQQQLMKVQWGFMTSYGVLERTDTLLYIISDFNIPADSQNVKMNMTSRLAMLTDEFYKGTYTGANRTLADIAEYVLQKSNLATEIAGQTPWTIPEQLNEFTTSAPIPAEAANVILQYIALASCTWLSTKSDNGFIQFIVPSQETSEFCAIDTNTELGNPDMTVEDRLRSVTIGVYNYQVSSSSTEVGRGTYNLTGATTIRIKYSVSFATNVSASVSGATLQSATYYSSYAELNITASTSGADVTVVLNGNEIIETVTYIETYKNNLVSKGKDIVVDNPLITNTAKIKQLSDYVVKYYSKRNRFKIPYIGYPQLEPCDRIHLATIYGEDEVDVTNNTIEFNGAWTGTAEVI